MADYTLSDLLEDDVLGLPRGPMVFELGTCPDEGWVGFPEVRREYGDNSNTPFPIGPPTRNTVLPETALQIVNFAHQHVAWVPLAKDGYGARAGTDDSGIITATVARTDPVLSVLPHDPILRFWLRGNLVAASIRSDRDDRTINQGEEAEQDATLGGPGTFEVLNRARLLPWKTSWYPDMQAHRFGPYHPQFDASGWRNARVIALQGSKTPNWTGYPVGWPDPSAAWISGPSGTNDRAKPGVMWLHTTFYSTGGNRAMFWTGDDSCEPWIDGTPFSVIQTWKQLQKVSFQLSEGWHEVMMRVSNAAQPGSDPLRHNPMGGLLTLMRVGQGGKLSTVELRTNSSWRVLQYPSSTPGMRIGEILNYLLDMAENQLGITIKRTFKAKTDSKGKTWPLITDLTMQVGQKIGDCIRQLAETYCDVRMSAGSWTLSAWNKGTAGRAVSVTLDNSGGDECLESLDHKTAPPIATGLLIRWRDNWLPILRTPPAGYEPRVEHLQIPQVASQTSAGRIGNKLLDLWNKEQVQYTAAIHPRNNAQVPPIAFREFDFIGLPGPDLSIDAVEVKSWNIVVDGDYVKYGIEAGDLIATREEALQARMRRMIDGAVDGKTQQALPNRGDTFLYSAATVVQQPIVFDRDEAVVATESRPWTITASGLLQEVTLDVPSGNPVTVHIRLNGATVMTAASPGGIQYTATGYAVPVERGDFITAVSSDIGFGLVATVRWV